MKSRFETFLVLFCFCSACAHGAAGPSTDAGGFNEPQFVIEWDMRTLDGAHAQGVLLEGNGFQIVANKINVPPLVAVYFDQRYRGHSLKAFPRSTSEPVRAKQTNIDRAFTRYKIIYDLERVQILRDGRPLELLGAGEIEWLDSMTDFVGTNGAVNLRIPKSNMLVTNVSVRPLPAPRPSRYTYLGSIGNTSSNFYGPTMHAAYQSIKKMVIHPNGTDAFYTTGYNENLHELQKFDPARPQVVLTNFGRKITVLMGNALITNLTIAGNVLFAKRSDGVVDQYDTTTCKHLGASKSFPAPALPAASNPRVRTPLDWSQSPADGSIAVYDGAIDVVRVYDASGNKLLHSIGLTNGYANGPSILVPSPEKSFRDQVKLGALWYDKHDRAMNATVCFQKDGKLWVSDTTTGRMLRFTTNGGCDAWFMFVPHTYVASADPNNPQRVFNEYLEFRVDYNALTPTGGWVLTNYWGHNVIRDDTMNNGLFNVTTISNRTYALLFDPAYKNCDKGRRLAELTPAGLRVTSVSNLNCQFRLQPDGALQRIENEGGRDSITFTRQVITRIAPNGDPWYGEPKTIAKVTYDRKTDPAEFDYKIAGDKLIVYDTAGRHRGFHLGALLRAQNGLWLWRTLPSGPMNGRGNFDLEAQDAPGAEFVVVDDQIFALYRGEFWKKGRQANQIFHFTTEGKFVGQFGMPAYSDTMPNTIGSGANMFTLSYTKTNGAIYLFTNDEKGRGTQVWGVER